MASEACPACQRGEHRECWGVEPPPGVFAIACPCEAATVPTPLLERLAPIGSSFSSPAGATVAQILESLLSVRSTSPEQIARMERHLLEHFGSPPPPSDAELAAARAQLRSVIGRLEA